jgi:hypothetical protein
VRTPVKLTVPLLWPAEKPRNNLARSGPNGPVRQGIANTRILQVFQRDKRRFAGSGRI